MGEAPKTYRRVTVHPDGVQEYIDVPVYSPPDETDDVAEPTAKEEAEDASDSGS